MRYVGRKTINFTVSDAAVIIPRGGEGKLKTRAEKGGAARLGAGLVSLARARLRGSADLRIIAALSERELCPRSSPRVARPGRERYSLYARYSRHYNENSALRPVDRRCEVAAERPSTRDTLLDFPSTRTDEKVRLKQSKIKTTIRSENFL